MGAQTKHVFFFCFFFFFKEKKKERKKKIKKIGGTHNKHGSNDARVRIVILLTLSLIIFD